MAKGDKSRFAPLPARALGDPGLKLLDLKVLGVIAAHDRFSGANGAGAGCYMSNRNMAAILGCNYSSLARSITKLGLAPDDAKAKDRTDFGPYIVTERRSEPGKGRLKMHRVIYGADDEAVLQRRWTSKTVCPDANNSAQLICSQANGSTETVCPDANDDGKVVCLAERKNRRNPRDSDEQDIPLNGERYSIETGEINSAEAARLASRDAWQDQDSHLTIEARLAMFERTFRDGPPLTDLSANARWLSDIADHCDTVQSTQWAWRLWDDVTASMTQNEYDQFFSDDAEEGRNPAAQ